MSDIKTVTSEELELVKALQNSYLSTTYDIGQLYVDQKNSLETLDRIEKDIEKAFENLKELKKQEADISQKLQEKYGSSTIDLSTGNIV